LTRAENASHEVLIVLGERRRSPKTPCLEHGQRRGTAIELSKPRPAIDALDLLAQMPIPGRSDQVSKSALFDGVVITKIDGNRTAVGGAGCGGEWSPRQFRFPFP
jgi:hypothetical protein